MSKAPAKTAPPDDGAPIVKSKKKLIIIVAGAILLLSIIGGGAAIFLGKKNSTDKNKDKEHKEEPAKAPVFLPLDAFVVNLQSESGDKYLQVSMTLQVADEEQINIIKLNNAQLRSRLLMLLSSKDADEILTAEGKEILIGEIIEQVKLPFIPKGSPQKVSGVFFTSFIVQ